MKRDHASDPLLHMPSDFDLDDAFMSEADSAVEASEPPPDAARPQGRPLPAIIEPVSAGLETVTDATGSFSIAELLETDVPLDWREAVSIARRMCEAIAHHPAAGTHEYHLDPRQIEITEKGDVVVEPGEPGTDPFVKQIGRMLRALLEGREAPAQLRLLVSQAVFDVPGFVSLEEFSEALRSFEGQAQGDAVRVAFRRVREKKYTAPVASATTLPLALPATGQLSSVRAGNNSGEPKDVVVVERARQRLPRSHYLAAAAAIAVGAATPLVFWLNRDNYQIPIPAPQVAIVPTIPAVLTMAPSVVATTPSVAPQPTASAPPPEAAPTPPIPQPPVVAPPKPRLALQQPSLDAPPAAGRPEPVLPSVPEVPSAPRPRTVVPDAGQDRSLRTLALAFDHYNRARAALDQEQYEQALSEAGHAEALLATLDVSVPPGELRDRIGEIVARADAVRTREEARVYTTSDPDVTPPVAVGRQLPSTAPASLARTKVGTLELVIGRDGQVETLKLRTPLNRFHERMIVSAAKAWRYRPALKNGKPVRFVLVSSINLPENY